MRTAESFPRRFNLLRWFSLLSCITIILTTVITGAVLSRFLTDKLLTREASVMMEFINSMMRVEQTDKFFKGPDKAGMHGDIEEFFRHIGDIPGVLRANVYLPNRSIAWSTDEKLIGKEFTLNEELEGAFEGRPRISMGVVGSREKEEHVFFNAIGQRFVESYLPIFGIREDDAAVMAVVEIYRSPKFLFAAIEEGVHLMWLSAVVGGLFLFAVLFWVVRRADRIMRRQEADLVESERLGVTVEMSSAVAHSLRNPLASIRSSAELALDCNPADDIRERLEDITGQTDRLAQWVRQYLVSVSDEALAEGAADLKRALDASMENFEPQLGRRGIRLVIDMPADLPRVQANEAIVTQVFNSVISNALEAMPEGGTLTIGVRAAGDGSNLEVSIHNSGKAMTKREIEGAFQPFSTSKTGGLGLGLPLARRIANRLGGDLAISRDQSHGVTALFSLPVAR